MLEGKGRQREALLSGERAAGAGAALQELLKTLSPKP